MKSKKSLLIIISCLVIVAVISFSWKVISDRDVFVESKNGKWKLGYVKYDNISKYYCELTYQGKNPENIEYLAFEYYYEGANSSASSGNREEDIKFPLEFGLGGDKLKNGEKRIVKLKWKENGKAYKEDLIIKK